ncbi:MAG: hypothetical protein QOF57_2451 [Frankiaceae bacterium]|nr:hypothetical protein [Frankiaceae bacterium]
MHLSTLKKPATTAPASTGAATLKVAAIPRPTSPRWIALTVAAALVIVASVVLAVVLARGNRAPAAGTAASSGTLITQLHGIAGADAGAQAARNAVYAQLKYDRG